MGLSGFIMYCSRKWSQVLVHGLFSVLKESVLLYAQSSPSKMKTKNMVPISLLILILQWWLLIIALTHIWNERKDFITFKPLTQEDDTSGVTMIHKDQDFPQEIGDVTLRISDDKGEIHTMLLKDTLFSQSLQ